MRANWLAGKNTTGNGGQRRSALLGAARELRAGALNLAFQARPATVRPPRGRFPAVVGDHLPVLLVHGYGGSKSQWFRIEEALAAAGFGCVRTFEYDSLTNDIPALADQLGRAVHRLAAEAGVDDVHVIGHSLGGVIVRYAVSVAGLDPLIRTAVTVASPHGGCRLAQVGFGPAAAQLRPGSAVLRRLESTVRAGHARWVAFYSDADLVVPAARARIRPAALAATNIGVRGEGHLSILQSARLAAAVVCQLRDAEGTALAAGSPGALPAALPLAA